MFGSSDHAAPTPHSTCRPLVGSVTPALAETHDSALDSGHRSPPPPCSLARTARPTLGRLADPSPGTNGRRISSGPHRQPGRRLLTNPVSGELLEYGAKNLPATHRTSRPAPSPRTALPYFPPLPTTSPNSATWIIAKAGCRGPHCEPQPAPLLQRHHYARHNGRWTVETTPTTAASRGPHPPATPTRATRPPDDSCGRECGSRNSVAGAVPSSV